MQDLAASPARRGHKNALLEGAVQCIAERGFAATTARDLVAASHTNLASIGYHYGSKDRLMAEGLFEAARRWFLPLIAVVAAPGDGEPRARLRNALTLLFDSVEEHRGLVRSYFEAVSRADHDPALRERMAGHHHDLRQVLAAAIAGIAEEAGGEPAVAPSTIASFVGAAFDGLMVQWLLDPEGLAPRDELLRSFEVAIALASPPG
ncbi:MAG: TetR/AcrR family transcriptional regulator [Thermoleophilaceae bacterium]|nr:TetR/AcrR family transcriptional regulator [Thermoleophilaceae bacterium]